MSHVSALQFYNHTYLIKKQPETIETYTNICGPCKITPFLIQIFSYFP